MITEELLNKLNAADCLSVLAPEGLRKIISDRAQLLEALEKLEKRAAYLAHQCGYFQQDIVELVDARAAIAAAKGQ